MSPALQQLSAEFHDSVRIRVGVCLLLLMGWLMALSSVQDTVTAKGAKLELINEQIGRLLPYQNGKAWTTRSEEAEALRTRLLRELFSGARSKAQAQLRDQLGGLAAKNQMKVITLAVQATELTGAGATARGEAAAGGKGPSAAEAQSTPKSEPETLRANMTAEFSPPSLSAFLLALSKSEQKMVIDRLTVRNRPGSGQPPPQVEIELRAFLVASEAPP